ncbi:fimbria/pilus outer membrane usher protein [Qipengyuania sp. GH38]|uniref:fimbria/pilus outer membrane usher protein n=1 Tax=Qipengyuania intermedia TaxID=2867244 RepID=UPI001C868A94|nr:fimbria/pilus outer membrane usher protein [Qipengyuania intermedia]MBX7513627.1 fimbria/pilus outer membrane usher protein [Qipengyuania intermedia]
MLVSTAIALSTSPAEAMALGLAGPGDERASGGPVRAIPDDRAQDREEAADALSDAPQGYVYIDGKFVPAEPPVSSDERDGERSSRASGQGVGRDRQVTIELEANYSGQTIGQVVTRTTLTRPVALQSSQLRAILEPFIDAEVFRRLVALEGDFLSVEALADIGIGVSLDQADLSLVITAPPRDRGTAQVDLSALGLPADAISVQPSDFSAGITSVLSLSDNLSASGSLAADVVFSGYFNIGGVRGLNLDYGGVVRLDDQAGRRFEQDRIILFMDRPEQALRYEAGTLFNDFSTLAGNSDFLGVGLRKSYRTLQPNRVIRRLGQRSFTLERPGEVTVLVNGQEVARFESGPGPVDLNNIPLVNTSNDVSIIVEDEFGRRIGDNFSVATDAFLLEEGLTEFSFGAGQIRDFRNAGFSYSDEFTVGGNIQHGFSDTFTQGGYAFVSEDQQIAGSESVFAFLNGIAEVELSVSRTQGVGTGIAADTTFRIDDSLYNDLGQSLAVAVTYRDEKYTPIGSFFRTDLKLDSTAFYERGITDRFRINLSGSYSEFHTDGRNTLSASAGASYQIGPMIISGGVRYTSSSGSSDEAGLFINLTRRLGSRQSINAAYDTASERGALRFRRARRDEVGNLGYSAEIQSFQDEFAFSGVADYTANRFSTRVGIRQASGGGQFAGDTTASLRIQSGLAFADGKFGIARDPGRGFALVGRHESLSDATVEIGARARRSLRSRSDFLGPAAFRVTSPFQPQVFEVDVKDAPFGYDVGAGRYFVLPGARSGYYIEIGSDNYRGRALTFVRDGEDLGLKIGTLTNLQTQKSQAIFTNRNGRAVLMNLAPGRYRASFDQARLSYEFTIEEGSPVYEDLGTIELLPGAEQ